MRRGQSHTPDVRARMSAASKAAWADPDVRARMSAASKAAWADPDVRARISAARKAAWEARRPWLAAMTPEQRADYDTLRRSGYSVDEALAAMGMTRDGRV